MKTGLSLLPLMLSAAAVAALPQAGARNTQTRQTAQSPPTEGSRNRPERLEWFRDLGFGMFIHWSVDSQIGSVISHSLVGADGDYARRFFEQLPRTFNPRRFHPADWAALARLAGMQYVVFTAKHHSGFAMYATRTTAFGIMQTPFARDVTAEIIKAFRAEGLATGLYFSPDDFHYLHSKRKTIDRAPRPGVTPQEDAGLMALDQAQLKELLTQYGPIDLMFIDGPPEGLRDVCWDLQPAIVVTRGAIDTPEQRIPGVAMDRPWESCVTMGTQWHYKPTHETYKSGTQLIEMLIETRAKGGNFLLNVGPKPDGELPIEQEERLREIALWNFAFGESIRAVRPWVITNEGNVWFTKKKDENTVYAFITKGGTWMLGEQRAVTLRSIRATPETRVTVLGHDGAVLEYRPDVDPRPTWTQDAGGLHLSVTMAQRLYNDRRWPNPLVVKLTNVTPGLRPPTVEAPTAARSGAQASLGARLVDLGEAASVDVAFQYRRKKRAEELYEQDQPWKDTPWIPRASAGDFTARIDGLDAGEEYEYRAAVRHPLLTIVSEERTLAR